VKNRIRHKSNLRATETMALHLNLNILAVPDINKDQH